MTSAPVWYPGVQRLGQTGANTPPVDPLWTAPQSGAPVPPPLTGGCGTTGAPLRLGDAPAPVSPRYRGRLGTAAAVPLGGLRELQSQKVTESGLPISAEQHFNGLRRV